MTLAGPARPVVLLVHSKVMDKERDFAFGMQLRIILGIRGRIPGSLPEFPGKGADRLSRRPAAHSALTSMAGFIRMRVHSDARAVGMRAVVRFTIREA
jgi:hypothetical protein